MVNGAALYHIPLQIMLVIAVIYSYLLFSQLNSHRSIDVTRVYWAVYIYIAVKVNWSFPHAVSYITWTTWLATFLNTFVSIPTSKLQVLFY